ncbi:DUF1127 domain-containing protein [Ancylobacter mangrovi]|uniref:DUF1127 domain-containing protein n=1 Tax=Ancylobacter mangrovi TaxID=2972472 RepID=UPI0021615883|nr:DUF1127 domain-containing protein [Ancylobacter mangrovi]MCS0505094.1 hypothetical protein [Ancylobacter mangrovi]
MMPYQVVVGSGPTTGLNSISFPAVPWRRLWPRWASAAHRRRRRDYRLMLSLPDYLLDDMGLTRGDILDAMR